jgi:ATP-dependent DNA helicase RecG
MKKESETLELKKSLSQLKEGIISLSSMLNKQKKGELYFGINDEGKVCGIEIGKKTIADITHEIRTCLKPLPTKVLVNEIVEEEKSIIKVVVEGSDTPYSAYGRYYIRINDSDILMTSNQLEKYFAEKDDTYSGWELTETDNDVTDIDEELLIDCIRIANDNGRLNYVYRNAKEALNKLGLLTKNNKLNNAGRFLFGNDKPLTIKEATYPTDDRTNFGEIKEFSGNIIECIKESVSYIQNHISYKSQIVGIQRVETPEIPLRAIREIVVNSFAHCSYAKKGDFNQYVIYKSSIRIYNPGSIIKGTDPIEFASGRVGSKIRNLLIASVLYKYGYIDAFGTGFDRTFTLCAQSKINYNYLEDDFGFTFVFERKKDFLNDKINDKKNDKIKSNKNNVDAKIVTLLKLNKYMTIPEVAEMIKKSEPTIHRHLDSLVSKKMIKRVGSRKTGFWEIL